MNGVLQTLGTRLGGSALRNARRSVTQISAVVAERRALAAVPDDPAPGDLLRLTVAESWALLGDAGVGRLAYIAREGVPDIVPVNYEVDGRAVLVRSAVGPKLQAAERHEMVAFEVDAFDASTRSGWSVVVTGRARRVDDPDGTGGRGTWANGRRLHLIRIDVRRIDGRRLL